MILNIEKRLFMSPIRVLLVDDSLEFLQAASHFLSSDPRIEVVGQFLYAGDALNHVQDLCPDLVLMDLAMPIINGLEATRRIKAQNRPPRVIILTMYDNKEYYSASKAAMADGFVTKSEFGVQLLPLILNMFAERLKSNVGSNEIPC